MKEWQCHITRNHEEHKRKSLCDKDIRKEFHFTSIDHWYNNNRMVGRLVGCPNCLTAIESILKEEMHESRFRKQSS